MQRSVCLMYTSCMFAVLIINFIDAYYSVTITTSPTEGPHPIGSTFNLTCSTHPPPPDGVTYQWTSSDPLSSIYSPALDAYVPFALATIHPGHTKQARYFCHVYSGSDLLGVGSTVINVQGMHHGLTRLEWQKQILYM